MGAVWVQTETEGWINLDICQRIEPWQRKLPADARGPARQQRYWRVETSGGRFTEVPASNLDPYTLSRQFVPAAPGATVFLLSALEHFTSPEPRPCADDLYLEEVGIAAWAISAGEEADKSLARPVLTREAGSNETVLIPQPGGAFTDAGFDDRFESLEAAKAMILRRAQEAWDQKHPEGG